MVSNLPSELITPGMTESDK